jgi:hypothetical protein
MRVVSVDVHDVSDIGYQDWCDYTMRHINGNDLTRRLIYVAKTDTGLEGLGEYHDEEPQSVINQYIGTNPFDWMGDETSLPMGMAMYDLMGKAAGVPVYKLFGSMKRRWVPVSSWFVATHPEAMADAVTRYAEQGHMWLKYHVSPFHNVFDQTRAMQAVAPEGFQVHYDFTMYGSKGGDKFLQLLLALCEFPIAGCFEDTLWENDIQGYEELRKAVPRPIGLHHFPMGATTEVAHSTRPADFYMLGHAKLGYCMEKAGLFAAAGTPFMMQVGRDCCTVSVSRASFCAMQRRFCSCVYMCHWVGDASVDLRDHCDTCAHSPRAYLDSVDIIGIPYATQDIGGAITRAMVSHMSCVFPTATFHAISCSEIFGTKHRSPPPDDASQLASSGPYLCWAPSCRYSQPVAACGARLRRRLETGLWRRAALGRAAQP